MKTKATLITMLALASAALFGAASGCELVASVDRGRLDTGGAGGTTASGGTTTGGGGTGGVTTTGGGGGTTSSTCDPAACPAPTGACKVSYCDDMGQCAEKDADDGTPASKQIDGDCKIDVCTGGVPVAQNDDNDVEDDNQTCTIDSCDAGTAKHDPNVSGTACSENNGKVCDDAGNCVACNIDQDCTDPQKPVCDPTHVCVVAHCSNTTLDADETDVDCGGADCGKCADDLNCGADGDCQSNHCLGMKCKAGTCNDGVLNNMQLGETDVDCGGGTCPDCGFDKACKVNDDCKSADCAANDKCAANCSDTEKDQDESDVDCGGVCSDCVNGQTCNGKTDCQSNLCSSGTCAACAADVDCAAAEYCVSGVCVPDKATGLACGAGTECLTNNCVDGVCCGSASCGSCQSCGVAGSLGTCAPVLNAADPDSCTGTQSCDAAGVCKKLNGAACPSGMNSECLNNHCVDGVCCDAACTETCKACNVPGSVGTCSNVAPNTPDPMTCAGAGQACDGAGGCKLANGTACPNGNSDCGSGQCVDGVCCGSASCGTCQACNIAGSLGVCTNLAAGQPDPNSMPACGGNQACNGAGACKAIVGQACPGGNGDCANNQCVDGVCCSTACGGVCMQCNLAGSLGTCAPSLAGSDPAFECSGGGGNDCNGAGACGLGAAGAPCVANAMNVCANGNKDCPANGICP